MTNLNTERIDGEKVIFSGLACMNPVWTSKNAYIAFKNENTPRKIRGRQNDQF